MIRNYIFILTITLCLIFCISCSKEKDGKDAQDEAIESILSKYGDTCFVEKDGIYLYLVEEGTTPYQYDETITFKYNGQVLQNNYSFAKDKTITFQYNDSNILEGIHRAVPYLKHGSSGYLLIPYKYGYGKSRVGELEPYSTLLITFVSD